MWPFRKRKCYFFVIEINKVEKDKSIPPYALKYVQSYLKRRFRKVEYFEPFTSENTSKTFVILGSEGNGRKVNRNVMIFLLELYASMKDPSIQVTEDFPFTVKKVKSTEITIYKFKKYKV